MAKVYDERDLVSVIRGGQDSKIEKAAKKAEKSARQSAKADRDRKFDLVMKRMGCPEGSVEYKNAKRLAKTWRKQYGSEWADEVSASLMATEVCVQAARIEKNFKESPDPAVRAMYRRANRYESNHEPVPQFIGKSAGPSYAHPYMNIYGRLNERYNQDHENKSGIPDELWKQSFPPGWKV